MELYLSKKMNTSPLNRHISDPQFLMDLLQLF